MKKIILSILCVFAVSALYSSDTLNFSIFFEKPEYIRFGFYSDESCTTRAKDIVFDIPVGTKTESTSSFYLKWDCTTKSSGLKLSLIMSSQETMGQGNDAMLASPGQSGVPIYLNYNCTITLLDQAGTPSSISLTDSEVTSNNIPINRRTIELFEQNSAEVGSRATNRAKVDLKILSPNGFMSEPYKGYITLLLETV